MKYPSRAAFRSYPVLLAFICMLPAPFGVVEAANPDVPEVRITISSSDFSSINAVNQDNHTYKVKKSCTVSFRYPGESTDRFSVGCQIRNHGAYATHMTSNGKRSYRLKFKTAYGPKRLYYPVFERAPLHATTKQGFDNLVLRGGGNDTPQFQMYPMAWGWTYCMDEFVRATQLDMGGLGNRGTFVSLFINGSYWGLYNMTERADRAWAAMHIGGSKSDWVSYRDQEGDLSRWNTAYNRAKSAQNYNINDISPYLDLENFADLMILGMTVGSWDWSLANSWNVTKADGKTYFTMWDNEHGFAGVKQLSQVGHYIRTTADDMRWPGHAAPHLEMFFGGLIRNAAFKQIFSDRARLHLQTAGGALTDSEMRARWDAITAFVDEEISRDTSRWTSSKSTWLTNIGRARNLFIGNATAAFNAFNAKGWIVAPSDPPPSAPSDLAATAQSSSRVQVTWQDNSGSEAGYKLDRRVSGTVGPDSWVRVFTSGPDATRHTDTDLTAETKYYYQAKAYNASGNSAYTAIGDATTPAEEPPDGIAFGAEWKHRIGCSAPAGPAKAWRTLGYDDADWASGPAAFGYGDGPYGTELSAMHNADTTLYLRRAAGAQGTEHAGGHGSERRSDQLGPDVRPGADRIARRAAGRRGRRRRPHAGAVGSGRVRGRHESTGGRRRRRRRLAEHRGIRAGHRPERCRRGRGVAGRRCVGRRCSDRRVHGRQCGHGARLRGPDPPVRAAVARPRIGRVAGRAGHGPDRRHGRARVSRLDRRHGRRTVPSAHLA